VHQLIKIISGFQLLLGIVHIGFAFPLQQNTDTLWFVGSGMAIIFAALLNFVAVDRVDSTFTRAIAVAVNALTFALFSFALLVLKEPQVYVGMAVFLITTISFCFLPKRNL
jgi:hypothetical protein